jgi:hypothetical protein
MNDTLDDDLVIKLSSILNGSTGKKSILTRERNNESNIALDLVISRLTSQLTKNEIENIVNKNNSDYRSLLIFEGIKDYLKTNRKLSSFKEQFVFNKKSKLLNEMGLEIAVESYFSFNEMGENKKDDHFSLNLVSVEEVILSNLIFNSFENSEIRFKLKQTKAVSDLKSLIVVDAYYSTIRDSNRYKAVKEFLLDSEFRYDNAKSAFQDLTSKLEYYDQSMKKIKKTITQVEKKLNNLNVKTITEKKKIEKKTHQLEELVLIADELEETETSSQLTHLKLGLDKSMQLYEQLLEKEKEKYVQISSLGTKIMLRTNELFSSNENSLKEHINLYQNYKDEIEAYKSDNNTPPKDPALKEDYEKVQKTKNNLTNLISSKKEQGASLLKSKFVFIENSIQNIEGKSLSEVEELDSLVNKINSLQNYKKVLGVRKSSKKSIGLVKLKTETYHHKVKRVSDIYRELETMEKESSAFTSTQFFTLNYLQFDKKIVSLLSERELECQNYHIDENLQSTYDQIFNKKKSIEILLEENRVVIRDQLSERSSLLINNVQETVVGTGQVYEMMLDHKKQLTKISPLINYFLPSSSENVASAVNSINNKNEQYQKLKTERLETINGLESKINDHKNFIKKIIFDSFTKKMLDDYLLKVESLKQEYNLISGWSIDNHLANFISKAEHSLNKLATNFNKEIVTKKKKLLTFYQDNVKKMRGCNLNLRQGIDQLKSCQQSLDQLIPELEVAHVFIPDQKIISAKEQIFILQGSTIENESVYNVLLKNNKNKLKKEKIKLLGFFQELKNYLPGKTLNQHFFSERVKYLENLSKIITKNSGLYVDEGLRGEPYYARCSEIKDYVRESIHKKEDVVKTHLTDKNKILRSLKVDSKQELEQTISENVYLGLAEICCSELNTSYYNPFFSQHEIENKRMAFSNLIKKNKKLITQKTNAYQKIKKRRLSELKALTNMMDMCLKDYKDNFPTIAFSDKNLINTFINYMGSVSEIYQSIAEVDQFSHDQGVSTEINQFKVARTNFCNGFLYQINTLESKLNSDKDSHQNNVQNIYDSSRWYKFTTVKAFVENRKVKKCKKTLEKVEELTELKNDLSRYVKR